MGTSGVLATIPVDWIIGSIVDLDNNGREDVVWHHPPTGAAAAWLMNALTVDTAAIIDAP